MDRIKSIFVSTAITFWLVVLVWTLLQGFNNNLWYYGLLATSFIPVLFFARLFVFKTPRTSRNFIIITILIIAGMGWEYYYLLNDTGSKPVVALSALNLVFWLLYIYWYSVFPNRESSLLAVGNKLPSLTFIGQNGETVTSDSFEDKKLIYLFYRGNWCPLCMAQIKEISEQYRELNESGAEVLLISPQPHKFTVNLAKKMNVPFWFLTDVEGRMAKQLGIYVKGGTPFGMEVLGFDSDTVLPTVIITNESGNILYTDQTDNYRVRPEPGTFLKVLKGNA